jgi:transcriptional regulator with XRE-family HTH domain
MIEDINKRIIEVMVRTEHSKSSFAKALDVSLPLITHITTGRNKPGLDLIQKLLTHFDHISPDWLLLGSGSMYREKPENVDFSPILREIDELGNIISAVELSQQAVIQYHKILLDEVLHLKEMDHIIDSGTEKLRQIQNRLEIIRQQLKLKD